MFGSDLFQKLNIHNRKRRKTERLLSMADEQIKDKTKRSLAPVSTTELSIPTLIDPARSGQINLIRAVNDEAQTVINAIDDELNQLEQRKAQLIIERQVHIEMLDVVKRYSINLKPRKL